MYLTRRERKIIDAALECLTIEIINENYHFKMEDLYNLDEKLKHSFFIVKK